MVKGRPTMKVQLSGSARAAPEKTSASDAKAATRNMACIEDPPFEPRTVGAPRLPMSYGFRRRRQLVRAHAGIWRRLSLESLVQSDRLGRGGYAQGRRQRLLAALVHAERLRPAVERLV